ncbi:MAG: response regulator [Bdellovibrionales bacterium]|nr:response regulator [Bdellovibrionales bacterium]
MQIIDLLNKSYPKLDFNSEHKHNLDPRQLVSSVSDQFGIDENVMLEKIALDHGFFFQQDPKSLMQNQKKNEFSVSNYRKVGAVPIIKNGLVVAVCCTDPSYFEKSFKLYSSLKVFLSPWHKIEKTLDEYEKNQKEFRNEKEIRIRKQEESLIMKITKLLVDEATSYSSNLLTIQSDAGHMKYFFKTSSGKLATGTIKNKFSEKMFDYLQAKEKIQIENCNIMLNVKDSMIDIEWKFENNKVLSLPTLQAKKNIDKDISFNEILIIDDNQTFIKIFEKLLAKENYKVSSASDGHQGLLFLDRSEKLPSLIVCDLHMAGINGLEFVKRIKEEQSYKNIPLIILSSEDSCDIRSSFETLGINQFISKSSNPIELIEIISENLNKNKLADAPRDAAA